MTNAMFGVTIFVPRPIALDGILLSVPIAI